MREPIAMVCRAAGLMNVSMSMCEIKSMIVTRDSPHDRVRALTSGLDEDGFTHVLKVPIDAVRDILRRIDEHVTHLTFHYVEDTSDDVVSVALTSPPRPR